MFFKDNKIYIDAELYYTVNRVKNRIIFSPCKELRKIQKHFLNAIKWEYELKLSTLKTAQVHAGKKWVLKMDIKDFYGSVPREDILKFLKKVCSRIKYTNSVYYYNLVTVYGKLPTGAITSAHIANACFEHIDKEIRNICTIYGVEYSRYMDDLNFSCDSKNILNEVEKRVREILSSNGYNINPKKTKYISDNKRQEILGIVVNDNRTRLSNEFRRNIRAMMYKYAKLKRIIGNISINDCVNEQQLKGYIAYIKSIDESYYLKLKKYSRKLEKRFDLEKLPAFSIFSK